MSKSSSLPNILKEHQKESKLTLRYLQALSIHSQVLQSWGTLQLQLTRHFCCSYLSFSPSTRISSFSWGRPNFAEPNSFPRAGSIQGVSLPSSTPKSSASKNGLWTKGSFGGDKCEECLTDHTVREPQHYGEFGCRQRFCSHIGS